MICKVEFPSAYTKYKWAKERSKFTGFSPGSMFYSFYVFFAVMFILCWTNIKTSFSATYFKITQDCHGVVVALMAVVAVAVGVVLDKVAGGQVGHGEHVCVDV